MLWTTMNQVELILTILDKITAGSRYFWCESEGSDPAMLTSCEAVERKKKKKRKNNMKSEWVVTDCFGVIAPHTVRSSSPAAPHLAKDKANRGGRWCEGLQWMGPPEGSLAHAGCDVCVCVCVSLPSWAPRGGHCTDITGAYLKLCVLCVCMWLLFFFVGCKWPDALGVCKLCFKSRRPPRATIASPGIKDYFANFLRLTVYKTNGISHPRQPLLSLPF